MDKEKLKELIVKIGWEVSFLKEDIQMNRYSKEKTIGDIEDIQDHINKLLGSIVGEQFNSIIH